MSSEAADLAHRLARNAEAVCRCYLSNGRRQGRYWLVGDVANTPGRSLFVRLKGPDSGKGAAGKWTDAATGEHGDLLDLIAMNRGLDRMRDVFDEARLFLSLPRPKPKKRTQLPPAPTGSPESARRLFAMAQPISGTIAETYLRRRGITALHGLGALRFHPRCYYRPDHDAPTETWPALIAAVTDLTGMITGAHRTWLDPCGHDKAPVDTPRRAMGHLLGNGVRFGTAHDVMAAGEGIETMLSIRSTLPTMPLVAALSANHLAALQFPATLRRIYVAQDCDPAGDAVTATLTERAREAGIEPIALSPTRGDFNEDLRRLGLDDLRAALRVQLVPEDVVRFMIATEEAEMRAWNRTSARVFRPALVDLGEPFRRDRRPRPSRGRSDGKRSGSATAGGDYFPPPDQSATHTTSSSGFAARIKIAAARRPPLALRPLSLRSAVPVRSARRLVIAVKAAMGAADLTKGITAMTDHDGSGFEPPHASSPADLVLTELQLYGYRPFQDEPDPRPLPEAKVIGGAVADIFDALIATLQDTRLEPDLPDLLWSAVNLFHRATDRVERDLDDNEAAQKRSQKEQDGSEIRSVELERLIAEGLTLIERRNSMELFRDQAAEQFERQTGSSWRPRTGSMVNHRTLTAAMIDSRDFIAAKRRSEAEVLVPAGPKIAFTGGLEFNDHRAVWDRLDKVHAKHPDMVLLHGGSPKGAERIAACWANNRKIPQIVFKPDWTRHAKAAPFKRNDQILAVLPIGVIVFPGSGISANLADKARKLGIPVWKFGDEPATPKAGGGA